MGLGRWLTKVGAIGGAARLFIKTYEKFSAQNTEQREVFLAIVAWRCSYTGERLSDMATRDIVSSKSVREFVQKFVVYERAKDLVGASPAVIREIREVIDEICAERGY